MWPRLQHPASRAVPASRPASPGCAGLGDGVDTPWMKTVRLNSSLLGDFWGRDIELEACVLVPYGFDEATTPGGDADVRQTRAVGR